ncbi:hypothetical protein MHYP_G00179850, partial [Metynnis hypsauchen]
VVGAVARRVALLHVEQAQVVDGQARQRVARARVQHEDEAVLRAQRPRAQDAENHGAREQRRARGEHDVVEEDEVVARAREVDRQRDGAGVERHGVIRALGCACRRIRGSRLIYMLWARTARVDRSARERASGERGERPVL